MLTRSLQNKETWLFSARNYKALNFIFEWEERKSSSGVGKFYHLIFGRDRVCLLLHLLLLLISNFCEMSVLPWQAGALATFRRVRIERGLCIYGLLVIF
jgi:hypothetical protein